MMQRTTTPDAGRCKWVRGLARMANAHRGIKEGHRRRPTGVVACCVFGILLADGLVGRASALTILPLINEVTIRTPPDGKTFWTHDDLPVKVIHDGTYTFLALLSNDEDEPVRFQASAVLAIATECFAVGGPSLKRNAIPAGGSRVIRLRSRARCTAELGPGDYSAIFGGHASIGLVGEAGEEYDVVDSHDFRVENVAEPPVGALLPLGLLGLLAIQRRQLRSRVAVSH